MNINYVELEIILENIKKFNGEKPENDTSLPFNIYLERDKDETDLMELMKEPELTLDSWFVGYKYFIKNFYNIVDINRCYKYVLQGAMWLSSYEFKLDSGILGDYRYTIHNKDHLRVNTEYLKIVHDYIYYLSPLLCKFEACIEDKRIDRNVDEMDIKPENYGEDFKIVKWIFDESNMEKGFEFIVRLREDILAMFLPPIKLRRPIEDINCGDTPHYKYFSKLFPDKMGYLVSIIDYAQTNKHPLWVIYCIAETFTNYTGIKIYENCIFLRAYELQYDFSKVEYPYIYQLFNLKWRCYTKDNEMILESEDLIEILVCWMKQMNNYCDIIDFIYKNSKDITEFDLLC